MSQDLIGVMPQVPELRWMASDEVILARSLGRSIERNGWGYLTDPAFLYQPYWVRSGEHRVAMVFRDHYLSDRIGFTYKDMTGRQAAEDLMFRFACIHEAVKDDDQPHLVSVILDGENCWEHFEQNGETFLRSLYEMISGQTRVQAVTVTEFLNRFPPRAEIPRLATGSWINGNLETWIGEEAQNRGWDYLTRARDAMSEAEASGKVAPEALEKSRLAMMAAEGSDWFWWYYSHNVSDQDDLFDTLFRHHLAAVYKALDMPVPDWVGNADHRGASEADQPGCARVRPILPWTAAMSHLSPGRGAGYLEPSGSTGAMQQGSALLKRLYFGRDETTFRCGWNPIRACPGYVRRLLLCLASSDSAAERSVGIEGARV